jgi:hypothetical protein
MPLVPLNSVGFLARCTQPTDEILETIGNGFQVVDKTLWYIERVVIRLEQKTVVNAAMANCPFKCSNSLVG